MFSDIINCLRYPFLYPRNRFTGLHYNNWGILEWVKDKEKESSIFCHLVLSDKEISGIGKTLYLTDKKTLTLEIRGQEVWVVLGGPRKIFEKVVGKLKIPEPIKDVTWGEKEGEIKVWISRLPDKPTYIWARVIHNPWKMALGKMVNWFHSGPLQVFHCLPEYTELYALDKGWKIAFGENLCKDLRKALWKEGGIRAILKFRITQIKEKYGYLHFYYCNGGEEVEKVISKYEKISEETCIVCGKPATWRTTSWICPYCDECVSGNDPYGTAKRIKDEKEDRD